MSSGSPARSTESSLFGSPRPAPLPPRFGSTPSSDSSIEGFVVPTIPPRHDPLYLVPGPGGHELPRVSSNPLAVDHERVRRLMKYHIDVVPKCANCAEMGIACEFTESGIPCPPCALLAVPDCEYVDPEFFLVNLARHRDFFLCAERDALCSAVRDNQLAPSVFDREYERANFWFYCGAQGAIDRFKVNCEATGNLALRGYQLLASSSTDTGLLSRFLSLGAESQIHPTALGVVADRLRTLFCAAAGAD
ncbi:hypothetical protein MVEN_02643800 [Mycena venus]|uniref:Uncharacterized protein n=1 Tax=Mycena venus TaxID=2733690 RepID=A0A8H6TUS3_9AGAR|nr:hypothetical protein MVEN_02643800 [Mycena venus]